MDKYQRGKIYKIISTHTDMIYIGSTAEPTLARRLAGHRKSYNQYLEGRHNYISSFELLQHPEYKIVLVELFPCNLRDELLAREQHHIDLAGDNCVNKRKAFTGLTKQEYHANYHQQQYEENKEKILDRNKQYYEDNKERMKQKYEENKQKILDRKKQRVQCDCGSVICNGDKAKHNRTFIHTEYLKMLA